MQIQMGNITWKHMKDTQKVHTEISKQLTTHKKYIYSKTHTHKKKPQKENKNDYQNILRNKIQKHKNETPDGNTKTKHKNKYTKHKK